MSNYCIPPEIAMRLIRAAKQGDVIGRVGDLAEMTSSERRSAFAEHVGQDTAREINAQFERVLASNRAKAMEGWVKDTFSGAAKRNGQTKSALDKIAELKKQGLLTPEDEQQFFEDLVSDKLGISVSPEQAKTIAEKAQRVEDLAGETDELGLPTTAFFEAKSELEKYMQSQMPANQLRIFTSTIGRAMMLASFKSPIVNIESNTVQAMITAMERRFASNTYTGLNSDFARKYMKANWSIYQKSGYDLSRMISFADDKKILGEEITHSEGTGPVRFAGRVAEDIVFKQLMGAPDVFFASMHFADSANLASSTIARSEGFQGPAAKNRALAIFKDAILPEPKTIEGELVRAQGIADAQYATYTNKSTYSDAALQIRRVFNTISGDARIGDQIMPFVKTPANVVGAGIEFSGVGLPAELVLLPKALLQARKGEKQALKNSIRRIVRSGLGLTFAFLLSQLFDPEEFVGNYPVSEKERKLFEMKNAVANSVLINGTWVSLDYFGPLAAPFIGMMYAKKYAHSGTEGVLKYYQGVGSQALKIPGFQDFQDVVKDVTDFMNEKKTGQEELTTAATNMILDYARSRTIPAIVNDIAKATDQDRVMDIKSDPLARIKGAIPGLRQTLPEKETVTGNAVPKESAFTQLVFGSRVKTAVSDPMVRELIRLDEAGQLPAITDIEKSSERVKRLKTQLDERQYSNAVDYYQQLFKNGMEKTINNGKYKNANDEARKDMIEEAKNDALDTMLKKYRYKEPERKGAKSKSSFL